MFKKYLTTFFILALFLFSVSFTSFALIPSDQSQPPFKIYAMGDWRNCNYWQPFDMGSQYAEWWKYFSIANNLNDNNSLTQDYPSHYDWSKFETYLENAQNYQRSSNPKPVFLTIQLLIQNGNDFLNLAPNWLKNIPQATINVSCPSGSDTCQSSCPTLLNYPNFKDPNYQKALQNTIYQFGRKYNQDRRVAGIFIAAGLDDETRQAKRTTKNCDYYQAYTRHVSEHNFNEFVKKVTTWYRQAFPDKVLFLQTAAARLNNRRTLIDHALNQKVGIKMNALSAGDTPGGYRDYQDRQTFKDSQYHFLGASDYFHKTIPIAFEPKITVNNPQNAYWIITQALAHKADLIDIQSCPYLDCDKANPTQRLTCASPNSFDNTAAAQNYGISHYIPKITYLQEMIKESLGVHNPQQARMIWTILRDTESPSNNYDSGEYGDWDFFLYRPENIEDSSLELENIDSGGNPYRFNFPESATVKITGQGGVFGRQARKTTQKYMTFKADKNWTPKKQKTKGYKIIVTAKETGDRFSLEYYDKQGNLNKETIQKTSSQNFKDFVFTLPEAYFDNKFFSQEGPSNDKGADFRINSENDGPEIIHRVIILPLSYNFPSPFPVSSPENKATLKIAFDGIKKDRGQITLPQLKLVSSANTISLADQTVFWDSQKSSYLLFLDMDNIPAGSYSIYLTGPVHLKTVFHNIHLEKDKEIDLTAKSLPAGDLNHDGQINNQDLQIIDNYYSPVNQISSSCPSVPSSGFSCLADLNKDNFVNALDLSLLFSNLNKRADQEDLQQNSPTPQTPTVTFTPTPPLSSPQQIPLQGVSVSQPQPVLAASSKALYPNLAYDSQSQKFLAVWSDCRNFPETCGGYGRTNKNSIYGQLIDSSGTKIGVNFPISQDDYSNGIYSFEHPSAVFNPEGNYYLVSFQAFDTQNPSCPSGNFCYNIYAQKLSPNGSAIGSKFVISNASDNQWVPKIAYNSFSRKFLLTWHDHRHRNSPAFKEIYGQVLDNNANLINDNFTLNNLAPNYQEYSDIALNPNNHQFMVVFSDARDNSTEQDPKRNIYAQLLDENGSLLGENKPVFKNNYSLMYPKISFSPQSNKLLTVFLDREEESKNFPLARFLHPSLDSFSSTFKLDEIASLGYCTPAVSYSETDQTFLVAWQRKTSDETVIYGRLISADGSKMTAPFPISSQNALHKTHVNISYSPHSNKFLVIYNTGDSLYYNTVSGKPVGFP